jgi:hypothetical protein
MNQAKLQAGQWVENAQGVIGLVKAIWWHEWAMAWQMSVIVPGEQYLQIWWCDSATPVTIASKPEPHARVLLKDHYGIWYVGYILQVTSQEMLVQVQGYTEALWIGHWHLESGAA